MVVYLRCMKTLIFVILACCGSLDNNGFVYEAKNIQTNQTGNLYMNSQHNVGDTIKIEIK